MAVVTFHAKATLEGRAYLPGQTTEIPDRLVYPLLRQGVITVPGEYSAVFGRYKEAKAAAGYDAPAPIITARDPVPRR